MEYMATNPTVEIDPAFFFVPDDVIDVRAQSASDNPDITEQSTSSDDIDDATYEDPGLGESNPAEGEAVQTPQWISVYSQVVRIGPDGRAVVDVTFDVEDVMGAEDYELRVTK